MSGDIDERGAVPMRGVACVLLSGGMDSTACLHWARAKYRSVRAVGFDYGQPHRDAELTAAGKLARKWSIPFEVIALADALHSGILNGVPEHEPTPTTATHRAFVPGRNLVFLSLALARACQWWTDHGLDLVIGACAEDAAGFPDCTEQFLRAADRALSVAVDRKVHVNAPYLRMTKEQLLRDVELRFPSGLADVQASWSCYVGQGPCGKCTACVLRTRALTAKGLPDLCSAPKMHGGDSHRDYLLKGGG